MNEFTKENAAKYLPLLQALADGRVIQVWEGGKWVDTKHFDSDYGTECYRIKPEPRVVWVRGYCVMQREDVAKLRLEGIEEWHLNAMGWLKFAEVPE